MTFRIFFGNRVAAGGGGGPVTTDVSAKVSVSSLSTSQKTAVVEQTGTVRLLGTEAAEKLALASVEGVITFPGSSTAAATGAGQTDVSGVFAFASSQTSTKILWQFLRPVSDTEAGSWAPSVGNDLYAMVDEETASDDDYVYTTTGDDLFVVKLGSKPTPPTRIDHALLMRIPAGFSPNGSLTMRLLEGYPGGTTIKEWVIASPLADTDHELPLSEAEAGAIGDYSDLYVSGRTEP